MTEQEIFSAAIEIQDALARAAYVHDACDGDAELEEQVVALLQSHDEASQFIETPAANHTGLAETIVRDSIEENMEGDEDATSGEADFQRYLDPPTREGWLGRLGHYEIEAILGRGAFGIVAKAFDDKLHRAVAIKMMSPELASTSPPRKRFLREARAAAAVSHENIVGIHAVEEEPIPYLVMEYIAGETLQDRMNGHGPFSPHEVVSVGRQISSGLAAAHDVNLIHRDIKPANILVMEGPGERIKITDFGLARAVDDASMTRTGTIAGTPMYMAPEQARGETLDHRADLFSLGSVLYQMASGRPPFRASSTIAVLKRVCDDEPRPIDDVIPGAPKWMGEVIRGLLEKSPDARYQSASEVAETLSQCEKQLEVQGRVTTYTSPKGSSSDPSSDSSASQGAPDAAVNRAASRGVLTGMALVLIAIVSGIFLSRKLSDWTESPVPSLPATEVTGKLWFDGRDDWVEFPNVQWDYPQFTIEVFVTSQHGSDNGTIVHLSGSDSDKRELMSIYESGHAGPNERNGLAGIQGKTSYQCAYGSLVVGERQHRALVFDGRYLHYYVNGVWQGRRYAQPYEGLQWNMRRLHLGCDGGGRRFFQGMIDGLRISRVVRYEDNFDPITSFAADDVTLAMYDFSSGDGATLVDRSGNGLDGIIHGAIWAKNKNKEKKQKATSSEKQSESANSSP